MGIFDVPEWIHESIATWCKILHLSEWRIRVRMSIQPNSENAESIAVCESQPDINTASLSFRPDITPGDRDHQAIVIHELLHVMHARIDSVVEEAIILEMPEPSRAFAVRVYNQALESYTEALSNVLYTLQETIHVANATNSDNPEGDTGKSAETRSGNSRSRSSFLA